MSNPIVPLVLASILYLWVAWGYITGDTVKPGLALAMFCYCLANLGFIYDILTS